MPISATGDLQHYLAAAPRRRAELYERLLEIREAESVRHEAAGAELSVVQEGDDTRPRCGRVAEARRERQVVVHEQVARQLERRAGRWQAELQDHAATADGTDRGSHRLRRARRLDGEIEP